MSKWKSKLLEDETLPHDGKCAAYGCPLAGSTSHTTVGKVPNNGWVCRFHFFADASTWHEVTRKLRIQHLLPEQ